MLAYLGATNALAVLRLLPMSDRTLPVAGSTLPTRSGAVPVA